MRELPLFVPFEATYAGNDWLRVGYSLLSAINPAERDYLLPGPTPDCEGYTAVPMSTADAAIYTSYAMTLLQVPELSEDGADWSEAGVPLLPDEWQRYWSGHSERASVISMLTVLGVPKEQRDLFGRWLPQGSDDYVRTYAATVRALIRRVLEAVRGGQIFETCAENDILQDGVERLVDMGRDEETAKAGARSLRDTFHMVSKALARAPARLAWPWQGCRRPAPNRPP